MLGARLEEMVARVTGALRVLGHHHPAAAAYVLPGLRGAGWHTAPLAKAHHKPAFFAITALTLSRATRLNSIILPPGIIIILPLESLLRSVYDCDR